MPDQPKTTDIIKRLRAWDGCWPWHDAERAVSEAVDEIEGLRLMLAEAVIGWQEHDFDLQSFAREALAMLPKAPCRWCRNTGWVTTLMGEATATMKCEECACVR